MFIKKCGLSCVFLLMSVGYYFVVLYVVIVGVISLRFVLLYLGRVVLDIVIGVIWLFYLI